jgi:hypothetical protein
MLFFMIVGRIPGQQNCTQEQPGRFGQACDTNPLPMATVGQHQQSGDRDSSDLPTQQRFGPKARSTKIKTT